MQRPRNLDLISDIAACIGFFTRVPGTASLPARGFATALWAAPVAGALIGAASGIVLFLAVLVGLPVHIAALLGILASILLTGALHEDGLADVADGFGGGTTSADKLDIMRDSRIGSYGTLALVLSVLARWSAVGAILVAGGPATAVLALISAHAASRALLPAFAARVPPARGNGLSAGLGEIPDGSILAALLIGFLALLLSGAGFAVLAVVMLAGLFLLLRQFSLRQIGGQTGDVLGALQQASEIAVLIAISALAAA